MKPNSLSKLFRLLMLCALLLIPGSTLHAAEYTEITVSDSLIQSQGAYSAIQAALDEAHVKATADTPYRITVPQGTYTLTNTLHIYGNTYLKLTGVTFNAEKGSNRNMLFVGDVNDTHKGYYYQNITVDGGTWDQQGNSTTCFKITRTENFTLKNSVLTNCKNSHLVEVAGDKGLTIENCSFSDQELETTASTLTLEAIQLDILYSEHITGIVSEVLPLENVRISGCTFDNVPRGVGCHTAILNSPISGLEISNNTFTNVKSVAVRIVNATDCTISGNTITGTPAGIQVYSIIENGIFLSKTVDSSSKVSISYAEPGTSNIKITDNKITVTGKDPYAALDTDLSAAEDLTEMQGFNTAIIVSGTNLPSGLTESTEFDRDAVPAGNYYLDTVTVSGNELQTPDYGILVDDVKNSVIESNTVTTTQTHSADDYRYAIQLRNQSTNGTIRNNTITTPQTGILVFDQSAATSVTGNVIDTPTAYGILIKSASADEVTGNQVSSSGDYGIAVVVSSSVGSLGSNTISGGNTAICVTGGASVTTLSGNKLNSPQDRGIFIADSKVGTVKKNTVTEPGSNGIHLHSKASATTISGNTVTSPKDYGILIEGSTVTTVSKNTTSNGTTGISVISGANVTTLSGNKLNSPQNRGIFIAGSKVKAVKKNTITKPGANGIHLHSKASVTKISGNMITSPKNYGILVENSTASTIDGNTISKPKNIGILIYTGAKTKAIKNNVITSGSRRGISVNTLKCDMTISGNTVSKCKDFAIYCNPKSTAYTITVSGNKLTGRSKKTAGFRADSGKLVVEGNTVTACSLPIAFTGSTTASVYPNTLKKNSNNKVKTPSGYIGTPKAPSLTVTAKGSKTTVLKWSRISGATGYVVTRAMSQKGTYKTCATIKSGKTVTYKDSKLTKGKTYYYKVTSCVKSGKITIYSPESAVRSAKAK